MVLRIIQQGGRDFRDEVSTLLDVDKRIHKSPANSGEGHRDEVDNFFKSKTYADGTSCDGMIPQIRKALRGLEAGLKIAPKEHKVAVTTVDDLVSNTQSEVVRQLRSFNTQSHVIESRRRLWLLRLSYEVDQLLPDATVGRDEKSNVAAAERKFAQLSGEEPASIRQFRKIGHKYTIIANRKHGLGFLLLLGCQVRRVWVRSRYRT